MYITTYQLQTKNIFLTSSHLRLRLFIKHRLTEQSSYIFTYSLFFNRSKTQENIILIHSILCFLFFRVVDCNHNSSLPYHKSRSVSSIVSASNFGIDNRPLFANNHYPQQQQRIFHLNYNVVIRTSRGFTCKWCNQILDESVVIVSLI